VPKWPLKQQYPTGCSHGDESERQNLPIGGPCTLRMPNWPLWVESEGQNLPIGGSHTLEMPNQPLRVESKRQKRQMN